LFYGWWEPEIAAHLTSESTDQVFAALWQCRFLGLLVGTSLLDYSVGRGLERLQTPGHRKLLLTVSLVINLGVLGFFKYSGFLVHSFSELLASLDLAVQVRTLDLVLPVGISFYTFQSMSYAIDVYRRELPATRNLLHFLSYVSFFPQLVAGPIERAKHLLPQFGRTVVITRAMLEEGIWLMIWGMFKKVVIADNLAPLAEMVYGGTEFSSISVALGTVAFALQIYCDFSGYSDIARGSARVLGFDIMWNFDVPYSATSLRDFWRRWHISLSTWLRDYLYVPLGGNRLGSGRTYLNLIITMLLGGLWHGAAWNFVLWGLWHGIGLAGQRFWSEHFGVPKSPSLSRRTVTWSATLIFVLYGWLLFRAGSFAKVVEMTSALVNFSSPPWASSFVLNLIFFATPLVLMELWQVRSKNRLVALSLPGWMKAGLQGLLLIGIVIFWERKGSSFIYFQF
jgi:alginate O-acetyltransferase complex protein AlgI